LDLGNGLTTLLADLFEEIDLQDERPHGVLKGLSMQGVRAWRSSTQVSPDVVDNMVKPARNKPVPPSLHPTNMVSYLKQLIWAGIEAKHPDARDIETYTRELHDKYVTNINTKKVKGLYLPIDVHYLTLLHSLFRTTTHNLSIWWGVPNPKYVFSQMSQILRI